MEGIARDDKKFRRDTTQQRRFIVVEGVYRSTGEICPLPEIVALKDEFLYRIVLDESLSFGTMGATGRGLVEHFQLKPSDVEVLLVPLDTTLASVGGVCVGSREIVEHQRLSGAGYCFSASACPFLSAAAITSLQILEQTPSLIADLQSNTELLNKLLKKVTGMKIVSDKESPSVHLVLSKQLESQEAEAHKIMQIARICLERGIGLSCSKFNLKQKNMDIIRPCIVVNSSVDLTEKQIGSIVTALNAAIRATK